MIRVLEVCLTVLAVVAVVAATFGAHRLELTTAPEGVFPLPALDPITTATVKKPAPAVISPP